MTQEDEIENLKGQMAALQAFVQSAINISADLDGLLTAFELVLVDAEGVWAEASDEFHVGMSGKAALIRQHLAATKGLRPLPPRKVRIPLDPPSGSE
ncbi:hypothetical protein [Paraburkholderia unamae]|uniref:Uncharacterized protein n=1 Tax=Paraburkholderia unamae TaxID=219649 RepID=A0ABX5KPJ1_9BURK|nr:hypothetical protein [Paraburkholderia unamae]PVX84328.1 hypothetical protein C7402_105169 [Paraburkholderia unamae]